MEDNEYNLGVMEDSSSRISSSGHWSTEDADRGIPEHGSSGREMVVEGGTSSGEC